MKINVDLHVTGTIEIPDLSEVPEVPEHPAPEAWFAPTWPDNWLDQWDTTYTPGLGYIEPRGAELKVSFPRGESGKGLIFHGVHEPRDKVRLEYEVFIPEDFEWVLGGKMPGLGGGNSPAGGKDSSDGWGCRFMWRQDGDFMLYVYHVDKTSSYGQNIGRGVVNLQRGQWNKVAMEVTVSENRLRAELNGDEFINTTDVNLQNFPVTRTQFSCFYGGGGASWAPTRDGYYKIRNMKYWSEDV